MQVHTARTLACSFAVLIAGCGIEPAHRKQAVDRDKSSSAASEGALRVAQTKNAATDGSGVPPAQPQAERKIIYTGEMQILVKQFDDVPARLERLIADHGGYVASSSVREEQNAARSGTWTIRIPADKYTAFLNSMASLGQVTTRSIKSEEVTAEFYDLEARLSNHRQEEERLLEHLKGRTGKLEDILTVEREISRVRGEIERAEGRLRMLKDLAAMSTVTITVREVQDLVAATAPMPASFTERVSIAWHNALASVSQAGENVIVWLAGAAPWMAVLAAVGLPALFVARRLWRSLSRSMNAPTALGASGTA